MFPSAAETDPVGTRSRNSALGAFAVDYLTPLACGLIVFLIAAGVSPLIPNNVAWMEYRDLRQHFIGWEFFRHQAIGWPPGMLVQYGADQGGSLAATDSVPVLAFLFRPFAQWLPEPFQYAGLYMLLSFLLLAYFTWRILDEHTRTGLFAKILATILVCFSPILLFRLDHGDTLDLHWTVVAAFWLFLRPPEHRRIWAWPLLIAITTSISIYFLAMVSAIWAADWLRSAFNKTRSIKSLAIEAAILPVLVVAVLWPGGFFGMGGGFASEGFGVYRADMLSLIDPGTVFDYCDSLYPKPCIDWSLFLPHLPETADPGPYYSGEYEGFSYMGLGILGLALFALYLHWKSGVSILDKVSPWLLTMLGGMLIFSWSDNLSVGPYTLVETKLYVLLMAVIGAIAAVLLARPQSRFRRWLATLPRWFFPAVAAVAVLAVVVLFVLWLTLPYEQMFALSAPIRAFRSSGRFMSPVYFAILLASLVTVLRTLPRRRALIVLGVALLVQIVDTSPGWSAMHARLNRRGETLSTSLTSPFWNAAAGRYTVIRQSWEQGFDPPEAMDFGWLANQHRIATDITYLARTNPDAVAASTAAIQRRIAQGDWDASTLYVLNGSDAAQVAAHTDPAHHLLARVNGYLVLAPNWRDCGSCAQNFGAAEGVETLN